jgi:hypothetical protein
MKKPDLDYSLLARVYDISRQSIYNWVKKGTEYDELAKRGIAISPVYLEEVLKHVNPKRFDDLSKLPPRKLVEAEKIWLRLAFSCPTGPIIDPRPRIVIGALKGVYYDEKSQRWYPRPFIKLPG